MGLYSQILSNVKKETTLFEDFELGLVTFMPLTQTNWLGFVHSGSVKDWR